MRITGVFKIDKVAQLFTSCFKTVKKQTFLISAINLAALALTVMWMSFDPPRREKIIRSHEYIFLVCNPIYANTGFSLFIAVCAFTLTVALLCTFYVPSELEASPQFQRDKIHRILHVHSFVVIPGVLPGGVYL